MSNWHLAQKIPLIKNGIFNFMCLSDLSQVIWFPHACLIWVWAKTCLQKNCFNSLFRRHLWNCTTALAQDTKTLVKWSVMNTLIKLSLQYNVDQMANGKILMAVCSFDWFMAYSFCHDCPFSLSVGFVALKYWQLWKYWHTNYLDSSLPTSSANTE